MSTTLKYEGQGHRECFKQKHGHDRTGKRRNNLNAEGPYDEDNRPSGHEEGQEEERKEAREKRKKEGALMLEQNASGKDDARGAKLLGSYVDEVLAIRQPSSQFTDNVPAHVTEKDKFKYCNFVNRLNRPELVDIPLVSQLVKQKALKPVHTNQDKRLYYDVCQRLKRNDGGLRGPIESHRSRRRCGTPARWPRKNKYVQHLMLHDSRVTDTGVEELCSALRWHPSVHTLWLGNNPVGDRGVQALARLVHLNHNVKDLNVSNQRPPKTWFGQDSEADSSHLSVTYLGAVALAKSLQMQCQLTSINLADQRIRTRVRGPCSMPSLPPSSALSISRTIN